VFEVSRSDDNQNGQHERRRQCQQYRPSICRWT